MGKRQLINKTPVNTQPDLKAGHGIARGYQVVICKTESFIIAQCIQVLHPEKSFKRADPEMYICIDVGHRVTDPDAVLVKKLTQYR